LVELMVAVAGGLIVAVMVFGLARDGTRFYRREARAADATLAATLGFQRLQLDVSRAGFLSTPNVWSDPRLCGTVPSTWPGGLQTLASLQIQPSTIADPAGALLAANGRAPDELIVTGSFTSPEEFPMWGVLPGAGGDGYEVSLQTRVGPLARMGFVALSAADQLALLQRLFPAGRGLRLVEQAGSLQFATITGVNNAGTGPVVTVDGTLTLRGASSTSCGLRSNEVGTVNVVDIVRYRLMDLQNSTGSERAAYAALFDAPVDSELAEWDNGRTELVREELDTELAQIPGSLEVVAEYAVDFEFGLSVVTSMASGEPGPLAAVATDDDDVIATYAGPVGASGSTPERVRGIRARLGVRSRLPDREATVEGAADSPIAPGFYRMGLGAGATAPFARVRTLQSEIAIRNHESVNW
jgi:hypothetical protein